MASFGGAKASTSTGEKKEATPRAAQPANHNLLAEIQAGFKLKKVRQEEEAEEVGRKTSQMHDVAAILQRRMVQVLGRRDSSEEEDNAAEWDE